MKTKRRIPRLPFILGAGFAALAVLWWAVAIPALVKYPSSLNVSPHYTGTFSLMVNPATAAPLATPTQLPLTIDRNIKTVASSSSRVVIQETITEKAGDLINTVQTNSYVMDRRTMKNVPDPRAYAFDSSNVVNRAGAYRLNLPFNTSSSKSYPIYKNEIGTTYTMHGDTASPSVTKAGLHLRNFVATVNDVPLDPAYLAELNKLVPLPASLTLDQLKPQLKAAGLDVDAVLAAISPVITPTDLATLGQLASKPIPLQYVYSFNGQAAVEPTTGSEVDVKATESVGAKPVLSDVATLQTVLSHYPNVPAAVAAGQALTALSSAPATKLFEYSYQQTPASLQAIAHKVKSLRSQARLAELFVPAGLLAAAAISLLAGGAFFVFRRPRPPASPPDHGVPTIEPTPDRKHALAGSGR